MGYKALALLKNERKEKEKHTQDSELPKIAQMGCLDTTTLLSTFLHDKLVPVFSLLSYCWGCCLFVDPTLSAKGFISVAREM